MSTANPYITLATGVVVGAVIVLAVEYITAPAIAEKALNRLLPAALASAGLPPNPVTNGIIGGVARYVRLNLWSVLL